MRWWKTHASTPKAPVATLPLAAFNPALTDGLYASAVNRMHHIQISVQQEAEKQFRLHKHAQRRFAPPGAELDPIGVSLGEVVQYRRRPR